jgi:predicted DNA-binding transcriptional regulator YafY
LRGHDYRVIHHEVYLLGAFDSPSRGARLFLLQDSGSGSTLMATAEELSALVLEAQILTTAGPVREPQSR